MVMLGVKRSDSRDSRNRFVSAILTHLPGAWIQPSKSDMVALYRLRYRMAMEEQKYDAAMIFLNKILEEEPLDLEARLCKGEIYHRHLADYGSAVEHYNRVLKLTAGRDPDPVQSRARQSLSELMEMLS